MLRLWKNQLKLCLKMKELFKEERRTDGLRGWSEICGCLWVEGELKFGACIV